MVIAYDEEMVRRYMQEAVVFAQERPVLIDRFLEDATEVDVDALADQDGSVLIAGIMEHIEEAGVHSGDSSCVLPPQGLSSTVLATIQDYTERLARALRVIGLMNVQYAIKDGKVAYVARSESTRVAHRSLRQQSHWRATSQTGGWLDARRNTRRL